MESAKNENRIYLWTGYGFKELPAVSNRTEDARGNNLS